MRALMLLIFVFFSAIAQGQSPCDKVKLYDEVIVKGDQPTLHKLKKLDKKLIPDSTLLTMKNEIIKATSAGFFSGLTIKAIKLFDSSVARAWSWTHEPITDNNSEPVFFFYAVLFETKTTDEAPFVFRVDVLKNGELLDKKQIAFFGKGRLNIIGCKKLLTLILGDTIQPIKSIEDMSLAYSPKEQAVIWMVSSSVDKKTGIQYYKQVNAVTGVIIKRSFFDTYTPPQELQVEEPKGQLQH